MAGNEYYFFTDINQKAANAEDYINVQTSTGAYGPVTPGAVGMDEYRVTSVHTASFNPTAYAACEGIVCVQRIPGSSPALVNIVLKPLVQPALNFAPIKYIIYKGILADSLINGAETAAAGNNDLTKVIWEVQVKKNASAGTTLNPPAEALGVGLTGTNFADTDPIDNLFYRVGVTFQLPTVKGGWKIGQFDKTGFGMEVLMEGLAFHHPLSGARQLMNKISMATLTGDENEAQKFDHWHAKEQVLGYLDPCAFYGSFFRAGIQAKTSGTVPFVKKSADALYQDVLFPFANRNTAYLDIRNEHNFYFNYFGNYNDIIRLGNPLSLIDYYRSGWPILTLTSSDLSANNSTKARNAFELQLPEGDNPQPLVYVSQGYRDINRKRNGFPAELKSPERFFDAFLPAVNGYTTTRTSSGPSSLTFVVPNVLGLAATKPVSCYIRLKYLKQQQGVTTEPRVIRSQNYLDNLIWPIDLKILFGGAAAIKSAVYDEEIYVNAQEEEGLRFDCIARVGIASDSNNTSFFLVPTHIRTNEGKASAPLTISGETSDGLSSYPNLIASKFPPEKVLRSDLVLSPPEQGVIADFISDGDATRFIVPNFAKFLVIVVANSAYESWKINLAAALDGRFRIYLGLKNMQHGIDGIGVNYTSFDLALRGFVLDTNTGNYQVQEVDANVKVYAHVAS